MNLRWREGTGGKGLGDEEAHGEMGRSLDILIIGGGILQAVACPLYLSRRAALPWEARPLVEAPMRASVWLDGTLYPAKSWNRSALISEFT